MELVLCDLRDDLCDAWRNAFRGVRGVEVHCDDFLEMAADAYVSPANSHGIMDGGIDRALRGRFTGIEVWVQEGIDAVGGLLPVGEALVVETGDMDVPYLVCAPTMEFPSVIAHTNNVYRATLAAFRAIEGFDIERIAFPGMGTGVGRMPAGIAAKQMRQAWDDR